nr:immunoglobulin light chain junction region [Macaca mulatta]
DYYCSSYTTNDNWVF